MVEQSSSYPRVSAPLCGFKGSIYYACALLAVTAGALAFRLPGLEKRPMHVDEAVQAVKFGTLYETGVYRYDPNEFHGPTLNYATLLPAWLGAARDRTFAATSEFTYRIVPVLFGAGTVLLLFLLCDGLGWPATILAGVFTALSPALVFYNRYYIHESLLLFFTLGFIGAAWRYVQNRKLGWALLAGAFLGLMHATKETFVLSCVAMLAAVGCTFVWNRLRPSLPQRVSAAIQEDCGTVAGVGLPPLRVLLGALTAAALVSIVLFSSFFTNWAGLRDSVWTYLFWLKRAGGETLHNHPLQFYLARLLWFKEEGGPVWTEALIVLLALAGFVAALCGRGFAPRSSVVLARFLGFYTLGLTALYSLISYKTPWCMLTFLHGMILLAGLGAVAIMRSLPHWTLKALAGVLLAVGLGHLGWEAYRASFNQKYYADWRNPYVYAHTIPDIRNFAGRMEGLAQAHPDGYGMLVKVIARDAHDYWPVPWYLRCFRQVGYWPEPPADADAPVVIAAKVVSDEEDSSPDVQALLSHALRGKYAPPQLFGLRPGVFLVVYVEQGLWDEFLRRKAKQRL